MPSERVSDGILFDEDVSAAALSACCHLAVFLPGFIRFYCCNGDGRRNRGIYRQ